MNLKQLRDRRAEVVTEGEAIVALWRAERRDGTDAELTTLRGLKVEQEQLDVDITKAEELAEIQRTFGADPSASGIAGGNARVEDDPNRGFAHFGEFVMAVYNANPAVGRGLVVDERLRFMGAAPGTGTTGQESSGADGGYLVPPGFSETIYSHSLEEDAILPMTDNNEILGNTMSFPKDETTPWGSNGVRAYWEAEAAVATQTKPVVGRSDMRLHKLFALVPMTEELLSDAGAAGSFIERKASDSIRWKTNDSFVNGTGAGKPMGILNAGALVTQAKEGSQVADTIVAANISKMFARNLNPGRAVWMVNPDAYHQLPLMTIGDQPIFVPPNGFQGAPAGVLFARPVILSDTCQTIGNLGDIYFVDWRAYVTITKAGGIRSATSMHLWFDYDISAFRATFRIDGQPWMADPVTPPNSTVTRSSIVTLAARA